MIHSIASFFSQSIGHCADFARRRSPAATGRSGGGRVGAPEELGFARGATQSETVCPGSSSRNFLFWSREVQDLKCFHFSLLDLMYCKDIVVSI
jgi:hypothetical protein